MVKGLDWLALADNTWSGLPEVLQRQYPWGPGWDEYRTPGRARKLVYALRMSGYKGKSVKDIGGYLVPPDDLDPDRVSDKSLNYARRLVTFKMNEHEVVPGTTWVRDEALFNWTLARPSRDVVNRSIDLLKTRKNVSSEPPWLQRFDKPPRDQRIKPGFYLVHGEDVYHAIKAGHGGIYAKVLDRATGAFVYEPGALRDIPTDAQPMTNTQLARHDVPAQY